MRASRRVQVLLAAVLGCAALLLLWLDRTDDGPAAAAAAAAAACEASSGAAAAVGERPAFDLESAMVVRGRLPPVAAGTASDPATGERSGRPSAAEPAGSGAPVFATLATRGESSPAVPRRASSRSRSLRPGPARPVLREPAASPGELANDVIRRTFARKRRALEACYWRARGIDPTLEGDVTFQVAVGEAGNVRVEVGEDSSRLRAAGVTDCIRARLEALDFAAHPPRGGDLRLRLPLSFVAVAEAPPPGIQIPRRTGPGRRRFP